MASKFTLQELKCASADRMPTLSLSDSRGGTKDSAESASSSQGSDLESAKQHPTERMNDCEIDLSVLYDARRNSDMLAQFFSRLLADRPSPAFTERADETVEQFVPQISETDMEEEEKSCILCSKEHVDMVKRIEDVEQLHTIVMQQLTAMKSSVVLSATSSEIMVWKMTKEVVKDLENQNAMLRGIEASVQRTTTAVTSMRNLTNSSDSTTFLAKNSGTLLFVLLVATPALMLLMMIIILSHLR